MTNPFHQHGITHLSPSTINLFASEPALFVMQKLLKLPTPVGCAAHRGTGVETGIVHGLINRNATIEECQAKGVAEFDRLSILSGDPRRDKERDAIPGIIETGLPELLAYGPPDMIQTRIHRSIDGIPVPFVGYIDLGWTNFGITLDIKSQLKLSQTINSAHARQVSIYIHGTNHQGRVAYITPKKIGVYPIKDQARQIGDVLAIAKTMERFLSISSDPLVLAGIVCPDLDAFHYSDSTTRAMAREVFGFDQVSAQAESATPGGVEQPAYEENY